jgi:hypothetical protein
MFVIYEKSSTLIMGKVYMGEMRPDHRKIYKTMSAAKAALSRASKQWWDLHGRYGDPEENNPIYRMGIAEVNHFHKTIEKRVAKRNLSTGIVYEETVNTPAHMSPACETYYSM